MRNIMLTVYLLVVSQVALAAGGGMARINFTESGLGLGGGAMAGPLAFCVLTQVADDTTPDVGVLGGCAAGTGGNIIKTSTGHSAPVAITDFGSALVGQLIIVHGSGGANATTIANASNFTLEADWTGTLNNELVLWTIAANTFIEVGRHNGPRTFDGTISLENAETIDNANDGVIRLTGVGGTNNEDLSFDLETTANTVALGSGTGAIFLNAGPFNIKILDDKFITVGTTNTGSLRHVVATMTPDSVVLGVGADSRTMLVVDNADWAEVMAIDAETNPTVRIHSADATDDTQHIKFNHDQTDGNVITGAGDLKLDPANGITCMGISGTPVTSDEDICFDTDTSANGIQLVSNTGASVLYHGLFSDKYADDKLIILGADGDNKLTYSVATQTPDTLVLGLNAASRTLLLVENADYAETMITTAETNPTLRIHSADATVDAEHIKFTHDGTDGVITTGAGTINLTGATITESGATDSALLVTKTLNDTGAPDATEDFTALKVNLTETDKTGWATVNLMDLQLGGTTQFLVTDAGAAKAASSVQAGATANIQWNTRTKMSASADGNLYLSNTARNDFGLLQLGGTTSSFPALKRSATALELKLADDSAYTGLNTGAITMDDVGASVNSPMLSLKGDSAGTEVEGQIQLMYGADPYIRISVDDDHTTPAMTAVIDIHDAAISFPNDNTTDLGATGANRPKDLYLAGNATIGQTGLAMFAGRSEISSSADGYIMLTNDAASAFTALTLGPETTAGIRLKVNGDLLELHEGDESTRVSLGAEDIVSYGTFIQAAAGGYYDWNGRSEMYSPADGNILLTDDAATSFGLLQLGGVTSAFPALKRAGAGLEARLADDSGYTSMTITSLGLFNNLDWAAGSTMSSPSDGKILATTDATTETSDIQAGDFQSTGLLTAKGASTTMEQPVGQELTCDGSGTLVTSGLVPDGAFLLGISTRITTALTGGVTTVGIGDGTDPNIFGDQGTVTIGETTTNADATANFANPQWNGGLEVTLTYTGSCTAGVMMVVPHYISVTAPTSN